MIQLFSRFTVTFVRSLLRILLIVMSLFALLVSLLGYLRIFSRVPQLLLRLAFSITDLRTIRNDISRRIRPSGRWWRRSASTRATG